MASLFPGMDPYLEQPALWASFHSRLIVAIVNAIEEHLSEQYYVEVETRPYQDDSSDGLLIGIPDISVVSNRKTSSDEGITSTATQARPKQVTLPMPVEVKEHYLEVRDINTGAVITAIELLSPKNKRTGEGRSRYLKKRVDILSSASHLVEIDLLRAGEPMPVLGGRDRSAYRILVSRSSQRPAADLYNIDLLQPLPTVPIPLKAEQEFVNVALQSVLDNVYRQARYATRIDYAQSPPPPALSEEETAWLERSRTKDSRSKNSQST